jgi:multiple sugar transport system permease protein
VIFLEKEQTKRVVAWIIITIILVVNVLPFVWLILTSLKTRLDIFAIPPRFIFQPTWKNYLSAFGKRHFLPMFYNSLIISVSTTLLSLAVGTLGAYALARFRLFGGKHISFWILSTRMFPPIVLVIPFYIMATRWGLHDSRFLMVIVYTTFNLPFVVWIMRSFFEDIPYDLEKAAMADGYTRWDAFWKIILPLSAPGLVTTAILCFIFSWNEFLFANVLTAAVAKTVPVGIRGLVTSRAIEWGEIAAVATLQVIPVLVFTFAVQKYIIRGLTLGAVKG